MFYFRTLVETVTDLEAGMGLGCTNKQIYKHTPAHTHTVYKSLAVLSRESEKKNVVGKKRERVVIIVSLQVTSNVYF